MRLVSADAEEQLRELQKDLRFIVQEISVESCVEKLSSDFRIPEYQRELVWNDEQKSKFIESVLLGLPVPFIFGVAEEAHDDRIAIIDGRQRLGALESFLTNSLVLTQLEKLDAFEGFRFSDFSDLQQRRFQRRGIRVVVLDSADMSTQFDMFERLNTTGKNPTRAEIRRGAFPGPITELIKRMARNPVFEELTPMRSTQVDQREREELALRLLAFSTAYQEFQHSVKGFLDGFLREQNRLAEADPAIVEHYERMFQGVCQFAKANLTGGDFSRESRNQTARVRFEALAVGIALALEERPEITTADMEWADEKEFEDLTTSDASNSRPKVVNRIEFARDRILKNAR